MGRIAVEVAYAPSAEQQVLLQLDDVPTGSSIEAVLLQSGLLVRFPEIDLDKHRVGIYGQSKLVSDTVCDGDRLEVYRPLLIDPKEVRRLRARKQAKRK